MAFTSPSKTSPGRLSYLPSDVVEDIGIIDFQDTMYAFLEKDEFYLFEDILPDHPKAYQKAMDWLESVFPFTHHDPFFDSTKANITPVNKNFECLPTAFPTRFNTATITRAKIECLEKEVTKPVTPIGGRFGTITKRSIQLRDTPTTGTDSDIGNSTYELVSINRTHEAMSNEIDEDVYNANSNTNTIPPGRLSYTVRSNTQANNDETATCPLSRNYPTISRNEIRRNPQSFFRQNSDFEKGNEQLEQYTQQNGYYGASNENGRNSPIMESTLPNTNTITKNRRSFTVRPSEQTIFNKSPNEEEISVSSALTGSTSSRNYPTISRNDTQTILQPSRFANSNDDLVSDSSSAISAVSNFSMTSSMSGRSEPNLHHPLVIGQPANGGRKPMTSRASLVNMNGVSNASRLVRPSSQNGTPNRNSYSKLPGSSAAFGSMGSLQPPSNMARMSSQTAICEDNARGGFSSTSQLLSQLSSPALSRNSTFRVHRPSPIPSVTTVFADQPVAPSNVNGGGTRRSNSSSKYNSDDNILHTSQEEIDQFRAKVLNSSNGNLRGSNHPYPPVPSQQTGGNHQNRSDSPSSNSSSCSSNSSTSRLRFAPNSSLTNRLNNNHSQTNSKSGSSTSLKSYNSNFSSSFASNNNNGILGCFVANDGERNGASLSTTNSKAANSQFPARPKAIVANTSNRSAIPISGTIPRSTGASQSEIMFKRMRPVSAFPVTLTANKLGQPQQLISNKLVDDNSWQNDCF